jgi:hypothetical protein
LAHADGLCDSHSLQHAPGKLRNCTPLTLQSDALENLLNPLRKILAANSDSRP